MFACAFGLNVVAGDQYIALVLPTKVFRAEFAKPGPRPDQPVAPRRRQRHGHVTARAVELVRRVHGGGAGRLDAALPAVRPVQHRQPAASAWPTGSRGSGSIDRWPTHQRGRPTSTETADRTATDRAGTEPAGGVQRVTLVTLTAMVVGGMVGAGRVLAAPPLRHRDRRLRRADRLGDRGHGHADAGVRLPDARGAQARPRLRGVRLRQGRLRRVPRVLLRLRLLGQLLRRQRHLLGAHHVDHRARSSRGSAKATPCLAVALSTIGIWAFARPDPARGPARRRRSTRS